MKLLIVGVVVLAVGFILFLFFFGTSKATVRTMYAAYHACRDKLGPDAPEQEVLYRVLRTRPPFDNSPEEILRDIIRNCPDIKSLTAFVIGFDKHSREQM
jgi:hypothetical protein